MKRKLSMITQIIDKPKEQKNKMKIEDKSRADEGEKTQLKSIYKIQKGIRNLINKFKIFQ